MKLSELLINKRTKFKLYFTFYSRKYKFIYINGLKSQCVSNLCVLMRILTYQVTESRVYKNRIGLHLQTQQKSCNYKRRKIQYDIKFNTNKFVDICNRIKIKLTGAVFSSGSHANRIDDLAISRRPILVILWIIT